MIGIPRLEFSGYLEGRPIILYKYGRITRLNEYDSFAYNSHKYYKVLEKEDLKELL